MTLNDLEFITQEYHGDQQDFFTINSRYWGNTYDHQVFHVYDSISNSYTSYDAEQFNNLLSSGYFNQNNNVSVSNDQIQFSSSAPDWIKTVFIAASVIMIIYLIKQ